MKSSLPAVKTASDLSIAGRILLLVLTIGAFGLVWWSINRLLPLQGQYAKLTAQVLPQEYEADRTETAQARKEQETANSRYEAAYRDRLANRKEVEAWVKRLEELAEPLALGLELQFSTPVSQAGEDQGLATLPVTLEIEPLPGFASTDSAYQRVLQFIQAAGTTEKRADLLQLTVMGRSNSVSRATARVQLWVKAEVQ